MIPSNRRSLPERSEMQTFFGFVLAGGAATVLNYAVFIVLVLAGVHYLTASGIGYVSGILVSFTINRRLIFRSTGAATPQLVRYATAYGLALVVQLALLEGLVRLGLTPTIANAVALFLVVIANYFVIKKFVFPVAGR